MKWVRTNLTFALVSILTVACSGAAPTYTPVPTVNVDATVESAIEATSTTVADETGGVCSGIAGPWLGAAVSTKTRTG